jgi:predicted cupin superfamily sugar epimerase
MTATYYMLTDDNNIAQYHMIYPDGHDEKIIVGPNILKTSNYGLLLLLVLTKLWHLQSGGTYIRDFRIGE